MTDVASAVAAETNPVGAEVAPINATEQHARPAKPDIRIGLLIIVCFMVGTGTLHAELASVALTGLAFLLALLTGLGKRLWSFVAFYLVARLIWWLCLIGVAVPGVAYLGIIVTLALRSFPAYLALWVIFSKIPMNQLMAGLSRLKIPRTFLIVSMVVYRYVPTLFGELIIIRSSYRLRCLKPWWKRWVCHPVQEMENLVVPILMRTGRIADELSAVALCKGLDETAERSSLVTPRIQLVDIAYLVLVAGVLALLIWADPMLGSGGLR